MVGSISANLNRSILFFDIYCISFAKVLVVQATHAIGKINLPGHFFI